MEKDDIRVQVEIHGRTYTLRGSQSAEHVRRLAAYVDERMSEIASQTETVDTTKVAILAALNLADELFDKRAGGTAPPLAGDASERDQELCNLLDRVLVG